MKALYILMLIPALAFGADEAQVGCELAKAQAEVSATILADPSAIALAGDPSVTATQSVAFGVSQSVSGIFRARDVRKSANAKCDALYAETNLDLYEKWSILMAQRKGDIAEQNALDDSMELQKGYVETLTEQLKNGLTTIITVKAADSVILNTVARQDDLANRMAIEIIPAPDGDLDGLIKEAAIKEGTSAMLSAKSQANSGWDFQVSAGARTPISGGATQGFVSASIKYSFGTSAANRAAKLVGEKTQELLDIQNAGYSQTIQRNRVELLRVIDIERKTIQALEHEQARIQILRQPLIGIDSILAKNAISEANIQISIVQASINGSKARLEAYNALLSRFTLIK